MKKQPISVLSLFLAALMLLPSCSQTPEQTADEPDSANAVTADAGSSDAPAPETEPVDDADDFSAYMPTGDYDGFEFCILKSPDIGWALDEVCAEEVTGEAYNDAIYNRNSRIEEAFNISVTQFDGSVDAAIKSAVSAGDDVYAIAYPSLASASNLAAQNLLVDLLKRDEFHFDMPWWDSAARDYLTVAGRLFFAENEINIQYDEATWALYFNKDLVGLYSMENPYELIRENEWTMDKMRGMMTVVARDADGDGLVSAQDYFGFATHGGSYVGMLSGAGESLVSMTDEGDFQMNLTSDRVLRIAEKIGSILNDMTATVMPYRFSVSPGDAFFTGHCLFFGEVIGTFAHLREMEGDFGLIPFPKFESSQEYYTCEVLDTALAYTIPRSVSDKSRVCTISEALAIDSHGDFMNAYLDTTIMGKSIRDEDSRDMLELIFEYRVYDLGDIFEWGGVTSAFQKAVDEGASTMASTVQKIEKIFNKNMEKSLKAFAEADGE
ncbi:MAG: hypothetical protein E7576_03270 [Ruminococcaceae bacterium]|nr:hypothetical protein [Oscillospiraceae bacterium]